MKDAYDHGHDDSEDFPGFGSVREYLDPAKMAEPKAVVRARLEGYIAGQKSGYRTGMALGIAGMVLLIALIETIARIAT